MANRTKQPEGYIGISEKCVFAWKSLSNRYRDTLGTRGSLAARLARRLVGQEKIRGVNCDREKASGTQGTTGSTLSGFCLANVVL